MPANLPPQYFEAEKEYKNAKSIPEKIAALEAMLAIMPHHKGTDKLRAGLTRKIAQLRAQEETKRKTRKGSLFSIDKQGAAQVILVGLPNSGKSSIISKLTNATPEIADYPYTTSVPVIGMMEYEDIQIQLIDLPPIEDEVRRLPFYNLLRTADALLVIVDASQDPELDIQLILDCLEDGKVFSPMKRDEDIPVGGVKKKMLFVLNKMDMTEGEDHVAVLRKKYGDVLKFVPFSARTLVGHEELKNSIFDVVEIIRVYTKVPGKKPDMKAPFVLQRGSTVLDLAREIHHDFAENLRYARIWGSAKFDGQTVQKDYVLQDGDVVEIHI